MEIAKLFRVLVVGGASVAAACTPSEDPPVEEDASVADASADAMMSADAVPTDDATGMATECFCNTTECCDGANLRDGFICCWGTSC
jgi:hypothetical protein